MVDPLKRTTSNKYLQTTPRRKFGKLISDVEYVFNSCVLCGRHHTFVPDTLHYYKVNGTPDITQHKAIPFVQNSKRNGHYSVPVADLNKPGNVRIT